MHFAKVKYWKTNDSKNHQTWALGCPQFRSQNSLLGITKTPPAEMPKNGIVKISFVLYAYSPHGFMWNALENHGKTCLCPCRSGSLQKRSKIENVNITLYREHFHLPKSWKRGLPRWPFGGPLAPRGPPKGPPEHQGPFRTLQGPIWDPFGTILDPFWPIWVSI